MGHLFYAEFGGYPGDPAEHAKFTNVHTSGWDINYWSGTTASYGLGGPAAWTFSFPLGNQGFDNQTISMRAWAVRDGDVAAVPAPTAVWLLGSALGFFGWMQRRQRRRIP